MCGRKYAFVIYVIKNVKIRLKRLGSKSPFSRGEGGGGDAVVLAKRVTNRAHVLYPEVSDESCRGDKSCWRSIKFDMFCQPGDKSCRGDETCFNTREPGLKRNKLIQSHFIHPTRGNSIKKKRVLK